ncbi:MAG TPA: toprim domain-containing protein, partial [Rhizomicrobium sp.]|nr:toprim domain-containing protein [Rhizomicrobium sp.]
MKEWTDPNTGEIREKRIKNALLVPIRNARKEIVSIQAIFPSRENALQRDKDYLADGEKEGCWFSIGKPGEHDGRAVVVICEGYATGASVHESTGFGVVVAFDVNNLLPVAKAVRRLLPEAVIIIAGDNDAWTDKPVKNPGATIARQVAAAVRGRAAIPEFVNVEAKPTDFNDLHAAEGAEEVRRQLMLCLAPAASANVLAASPVAHVAGTVLDDDPHDARSYFTILGHDERDIHIYSHEKKMTVSHPAEKWTKGAMMAIAPLEWWENEFKGTKSTSDQWVSAAQNWLIRRAYGRGYFDPANQRGRGAWEDNGRIIFHFGDRLEIDRTLAPVGPVASSRFVYCRRPPIAAPPKEGLSDEVGLRLLEIAEQFCWRRPASGILLAGWCALS